MKKILPLMAILALGTAQSAFAGDCEMKSTATISMSVSGMSDTAKLAHSEIEKSFKRVEELGSEANLESFNLDKQDYRINAQNSSRYAPKLAFQYRASASYSIEPAEKAADLLTAITEEDMQGTVNVRRHKDNSPACRMKR